MKLLQQINQNIEKNNLFGKTSKLLLSISGGPDSVFLATTMHKLGYKFDMVSINYNLRQSSKYELLYVLDLSSKFKDMNIGIENMEYFSVVSIANKFNIPVAGIFIITNYTNQDAHKDFLYNHKEAMNRLVLYLKSNKIIT